MPQDSSLVQKMLAGTGWAGLAVGTGVVPTLGAMLVGIGIVFVPLLPFSILMVMPPYLWQAVGIAFLLAAPTTLVILPISALFMRRRAVAAMYLLPIVGLVCGAVTIWIVDRWLGQSLARNHALEVFLIAGAVAGLAAGALFGRALLEVGR